MKEQSSFTLIDPSDSSCSEDSDRQDDYHLKENQSNDDLLSSGICRDYEMRHSSIQDSSIN